MNQLESLKQYNLITYILYIVGLFVGFTGIIAVIMNYIKREEARNTWLESHINWQIQTFWYSLIGYIFGVLLVVILIGYLVLAVVFVWQAYRLVVGVNALTKNKVVNE